MFGMLSLTFQGKNKRIWERYILPFDLPETTTPQFVSEIIAWVTEGTVAERLEWNNKHIIV